MTKVRCLGPDCGVEFKPKYAGLVDREVFVESCPECRRPLEVQLRIVEGHSGEEKRETTEIAREYWALRILE